MSLFTDVHEDIQVVRAVRDLALEDYKGPGKTERQPREKYQWLRSAGSRLWLDTGDAEDADKVWGPEVEALTTNNTLVNKVVQTGAMDGLVGYAARRIRQARPDISDHDLVIEIAFLINARLALSLVGKFGAHVSVELHPDTAFDVRRTLIFARRYYEINPVFFYIKVPMTPDGFVSVRALSGEGIPVNYTLGFSARQNHLAAQFSRPRFVNVFLGRLNSLVEDNGLGKPENVGEKAALASSEAICSIRKLYSDTPTEQIAASMRNGEQVAALAGIDVLTIPPNALSEYLDMDVSRDDVRPRCSDEMRISLNESGMVRAPEFDKLWTVDEQFMAFTEDAVKQADQIADGKALVELSEEHGVGLFHEWTDEERAEIRKKGKIPELSGWWGIPIDDLMSISALESFGKDQQELDDRIERLIRES